MIRVSIDIGGTFTDCLVQYADGRVAAFKAPTTPDDPTQGLLDALAKAARSASRSLTDFVQELESIIHGTTLATNALLTGKGARVGMLTTRGFRDQIEARRGQKNIRTSMYNLFVPPYRPLVPRSRRLPITERILKDGSITVALDEDDARQAIGRLADDAVESIAICFLHAYANGEHEARVEQLCHEQLDSGVYVTTSHEVLPVWGEYERFSTTVVSAFVGPVVTDYLRRLEDRLAGLGFRGSLLIVQSDGLMQSAAASRRRIVGLVNSGPAAAPTAALSAGRSVATDNLISIDMGGTSFDVCLIEHGQIPTTTEGWVADERITIKMVDNLTVGAGGGSIVWVDDFGLLRVGPQSAGAQPGPASYGLGGVEPTVTDADVVLGYVPSDYFLGGEILLDAHKASQAIARLSDGIGMDVTNAALAVFTTVNSFMADQITEISTRRGLDIRDFALVVGGGAGPVHAAPIAEILGIPTVIVPRYSALYSAVGMLGMDIGREYVRSCIVAAPDIDLEQLRQLYAGMEREAIDDLRANHVDPRHRSFSHSAEMRYVGQFHSVEVPLPDVPGSLDDIRRAVAAFENRHRELYTFDLPFRTVEFMLLRLRASVPQTHVRVPPGGSDGPAEPKRSRLCFFGSRWVDTPCFEGERLSVGNFLVGPAIIEEKTTTVLIPGGFSCSVEQDRTYVLRQATA